jgi:hypothetical protein
MAPLLRIFPLWFLWRPKGRIGLSGAPLTDKIGWSTLRLRLSPWSIWSSTFAFGSLSRRSIFLPVPKILVWTLTPNRCYSANPAYKAQFLASLPCPFGNIVWKTWAPLSVASSSVLLSKTASGPMTV